MTGNKSFAILAIGAGVVLLYVAYTGRLASVWNGLKGDCDCGASTGTGNNAQGAPGGSAQPMTNPIQPHNPSNPVSSGAVRKITGRGAGAAGDGSYQPSRQYLNRGSYNVSSTGGIRVSDAGQN